MKTHIYVFFSFFACASAHLCLISPPQRGSMLGLNTIGTTDCMLVTGPCGNRPSQVPIKIAAGYKFRVTFQKNECHWLKNSPGYFAVTLIDGDADTPGEELARIPDKGQPDLTLFSVNVTMPSEPIETPLVLQAVYVTNDPSAPPVFYQCSDIELYREQ